MIGSVLFWVIVGGGVLLVLWILIDVTRHRADPWRYVAAVAAGAALIAAAGILMFDLPVQGNMVCGYSPATGAFGADQYGRFVGTDFTDSDQSTCIRDMRLRSVGSLGLVAVAGLLYIGVSDSARRRRRLLVLTGSAAVVVVGAGSYALATRSPAPGHFPGATPAMKGAIARFSGAVQTTLAPTHRSSAPESVRALAEHDYGFTRETPRWSAKATATAADPRILRQPTDTRADVDTTICTDTYDSHGREGSGGCDEWVLTLTRTANTWQVTRTRDVSPG